MPRGPIGWRILVVLFLLLGAAAILLQGYSAFVGRDIIRTVEHGAAQVQPAEVDHEKARQELIGRSFDNDAKRHPWVTLGTNLGSLASVLVALSGAILALQGYLGAREKERQDRLAGALGDTLKRLAAESDRERVVGIAGLLGFFTADRGDFHLQALTALIASARIEDKPGPQKAIRLAVEQAAKVVAPGILAQVSWKDVKLPGVNLAGRDLRNLDLRDAVLENAQLTGTRLDGADLNAAMLQGAQLQDASLTGSNLTHADLAGARANRAHLSRARVDGVKVLDLDLEGAELDGIVGDWRGVPWDASRNWRQARFDPTVREALLQRFGPAVSGPKVLMLMWEIPPLVAGGTWTAGYHMVRALRRRGADVTVVVPWTSAVILSSPFGCEVTVVPLEIVPPTTTSSPYAGQTPAWSPYGAAGAGWSPYGGAAPGWSPYTGGPYGGGSSGRGFDSWSPYGGGGGALWSGGTGSAGGASYGGGPYGPATSAYIRESLQGSVLFRLIGEFRYRVADHVTEHGADLIHAHDWVTFDAARAAAEQCGIPWIAHFHSTELDRHPDGGDPLIERIEQRAVASATRLVVPSKITRQALITRYQAAAERIDVVPNMLSEVGAPIAEMGRFETRRVMFLGRLTRQKGVDRFCDVADAVRRERPGVTFEAYGDGEERQLLQNRGITWRHAIGWDKRGTAFAGASVLIVPSRAEPFGMVILEGMEHRVPVIYPSDAGAAEVLQSGIKLPANDIAGMAAAVVRLLDRLDVWETLVREQAREIMAYPDHDFDARLQAVWQQAAAGAAHTHRQASANPASIARR